MKLLLPLLLLASKLAFSQEPKPIQVDASLFTANIFKPITLSQQLTLRPGLTVRKGSVYNTFETPVYLDYKINNRWSAYIGAHGRVVIGLNPEMPEYMGEIFDKPSEAYISIGTEYQFKNNAQADFSISFPLEMNFKLKF